MKATRKETKRKTTNSVQVLNSLQPVVPLAPGGQLDLIAKADDCCKLQRKCLFGYLRKHQPTSNHGKLADAHICVPWWSHLCTFASKKEFTILQSWFIWLERTDPESRLWRVQSPGTSQTSPLQPRHSSSRQISWSAVQTTILKTSLPGGKALGAARSETLCTGPEWCCKWSNKLAWPVFHSRCLFFAKKVWLPSIASQPGCCWYQLRPELQCWRPRHFGLAKLTPGWWAGDLQASSALKKNVVFFLAAWTQLPSKIVFSTTPQQRISRLALHDLPRRAVCKSGMPLLNDFIIPNGMFIPIQMEKNLESNINIHKSRSLWTLLDVLPSHPKLRAKTSAACRMGNGPSSMRPCNAAKRRTSPLLKPQATNQGDTATAESS